ncbi:hypothetical protein A2U01_0110445, partial [Trifolium medium]|nr:hypothetical protein [Trifolium medium]
DVPTEEDTDEISSSERPLGRIYFQRALRDLQAAQAAGAASGSTSHPPAAPVFEF